MQQLINLIISPAYAAEGAGAAAGQQGSMSFVIMMVIFVLFFYFAIWRPQSKRAREQQTLMDSLTKGDEVMTAGGMVGKIVKIGDQFITMSIASQVEVFVQKSSVVTVLPKGTLKSIA